VFYIRIIYIYVKYYTICNTYVRNDNSNNNNNIIANRLAGVRLVGGRSRRRWRSVVTTATCVQLLLLRADETSFSSGRNGSGGGGGTQIRQNVACLRVCNDKPCVKSSTGRRCVSARPSIVYGLRVCLRVRLLFGTGGLVRFLRDVFRVCVSRVTVDRTL